MAPEAAEPCPWPKARVLQSVVLWRALALIFLLACVLLLVVHNVGEETSISASKRRVATFPSLVSRYLSPHASSASIPCPPKKGGLVTSGEPASPGPFHDLTVAEYGRLNKFLRRLPGLNLADPDRAAVNTSNIFIVDLFMPDKQQTVNYLDLKKPQPPREAHVIIYRGDKSPPLVEEYRVGPLSKPSYARLIDNPQRRNPVEFSLRTIGRIEANAIVNLMLPKVDSVLGEVLRESYGGTFTDCGDRCLSVFFSLIGTGLHGDINARKYWAWATYPQEYYTLRALDFAVQLDGSGADTDLWTVQKVWYAGSLYDSMEELAYRYATDSYIKKTRLTYPRDTRNSKTTQDLRGIPVPETPMRPPQQLEPDGKRYTISHRHVTYLQWGFDVRISALTGPQVYDVRFNGERIVHELGLSEISVFYSGANPITMVTDYVDSGTLLGIHAKALVPGADCPDTATYLEVPLFGEGMQAPTTLRRAMCVFEHNTGLPLRRHLSYLKDQGSFYGGMADTTLVVRTILTVFNYDYLFDYIFHQNGAIEVLVASTGYILTSFYNESEDPYGWQIDQNILGPLHHHMFHFKADLDILGTSNRYETLDIVSEEVPLRQISPTATDYQLRFRRSLKTTENEAVYHYDFDQPKYHIVYNDQEKTQYGVPRAYRILPAGIAKQLLPEGPGNEPAISWARQELAVTVRKEDEQISGSNYAMFDSLNPVTSFSRFISNESLVDKDLVFWMTLSLHHIPHTEDLPVTTTAGKHVGFTLMPYNYFPECPSVSSRDQIRVDYVTPGVPQDGLRVHRYGNKPNDACGIKTLEQIVKERPDDILETNEEFKFL